MPPVEYPPVGGRLNQFAQEWLAISPGTWLLETVTKGYKIEFTRSPPSHTRRRQTQLPGDIELRRLLLEEVQSLRDKRAIVPVFPPFHGGFWSTFFLAPKKTGDWRPILNLKPLNRFIKPQSFRMETLASVLRCPIKHRWAASLDLKDAYLHVPISPCYQKWLRFQIDGQAYKFVCLPFGLSTAPRVFTRVVKEVGAYLKRRGVNMCQYLDDWLVYADSRAETTHHIQLVIQVITSLGFLVNYKKSQLDPSQLITYLGARLDLKKGLATPSQERVNNLAVCARILAEADTAPAVAWLKVLGLMASMVDLIPYCRLHMRVIQIHLMAHYKPSIHRVSRMVPLSDLIREELSWWYHRPNLTAGMAFPFPQTDCVITTDASKSGWGGHLLDNRASGRWTREEAAVHINLQELWAVELTLKWFVLELSGLNVLVQTDNSTVIAYLNKQGGTRSPTLCAHTMRMISWCQERKITLRAIHIAGVTNTLADDLSRGRLSGPAEISLSPQVVQTMFAKYYHPAIDLFASHRNKQLPVYCSRTRDPGAYAVDALSVNWGGNVGVCLPSDLTTTKSSGESGSRRMLHSSRGSLLAKTRVVSTNGGLACGSSQATPPTTRPAQSGGSREPTAHRAPTVDCMAIIRHRCQEKGFSERTAELVASGRRQSTLTTYSKRLAPYYKWCNERNLDPTRATVSNISQFLTERFDSGLQSATVRNYKSAIMSIHKGYEDGSSANDGGEIRLLLNGMFNERPPTRKIVPVWELNTVLEYLKGPPFEPMAKASLKNITLKTVMLIALASAHRCSEIHSLSFASMTISRAGATLSFVPGFRAKNETSSHLFPTLFLPSLSTESSVYEDKLWCPVRCLRYYTDRTSSMRGNNIIDQLFITHAEPHKPAAKSTIARWLVQIVVDSKAIVVDERVRAHSTRALATSWAYHRGLSVKEICEAVSWRSATTFSSAYYRAIRGNSLRGQFARTVLSRTSSTQPRH